MSARVVPALGLLLSLALPAGADTLKAYPAPPVPMVYAAHNDGYTVRVRTPGGEWQDLYEYNIRVDWDKPQDASMVYFDFTGRVEVEVQKNNGTFDTVGVLPRKPDLKLTRAGKIVRFTLDQPGRFSLQFDDDRLHNLHILAGAPPPTRPEGENVRYYGPGIHAPDDGGRIFRPRSGETLYLDGGAILTGNFDLRNVENVRIMGRGLIYNTGRAIEIDGSQNVSLEDLIVVNDDKEAAARVSNIRHSANIRLTGISGFTSGKWSDGLGISTSQHVYVDQAYLRTSDDAVVVYAVNDCPICATKTDTAPSALSYDTYDIRVTNSILWNDVAHAMYVGHFGDNAHPRTIHSVTFDNIDVLNLDEDDEPWEGTMAIFSGDSTKIRDISFSRIRVERIEEGKLVHIVAGNSPRYNKAPGRGVENVTLRDISFTGEGMPSASIITGLSEDTAVRNVRIENLTIGGQKVTTPAQGDLKVGPFVSGFSLTK
ncbi:MAG: glycosyl hydrolase family 28 protein [Asticcacaulis sp.]